MLVAAVGVGKSGREDVALFPVGGDDGDQVGCPVCVDGTVCVAAGVGRPRGYVFVRICGGQCPGGAGARSDGHGMLVGRQRNAVSGGPQPDGPGRVVAGYTRPVGEGEGAGAEADQTDPDVRRSAGGVTEIDSGGPGVGRRHGGSQLDNLRPARLSEYRRRCHAGSAEEPDPTNDGDANPEGSAAACGWGHFGVDSIDQGRPKAGAESG